jgi:predicted SAM-dependent methyltransferase
MSLNLHLGCGKIFIPGFVHVDVRKFDHVDHVTSVDKLDMFADNSVDLVYACHLLEHFPRRQTLLVLTEWKRVLRRGGILRIAVPDFAALSKLYQETKDLSLILGPLVGKQDYEYNTHYRVFDYNSLSQLLYSIGFRGVGRYNWQERIHKDYDDYSQAYIPHMDKENGTLISLNIEATK